MLSKPMIRPTVLEDLDGLKSVIESTHLLPPEMLEPMVAPFLAPDGDGSMWLTLCEPDPIGVVYCVPERLTEGTWNILLLAVHADLQNSGRGARLVAHLEESLQAKRARLLIVETSGLEEFEPTRRFYRKLDYIEVGCIPDFYSPGDDRVTFIKVL